MWIHRFLPDQARADVSGPPVQRTLEKETSLVGSKTVVSRRSTRTVVPEWSTRVSLSVSILTVNVDGSFLSVYPRRYAHLFTERE